MNSEFPHTPREELEASITAMLLGELPSDKAFALGRAIEQDPELAKVYHRLKKTIELVHTAEKPDTNVTTANAPAPKLNEQRRQELLQHFKTVAPKEFVETPPQAGTKWMLEIAVAACILFLMAALLLPALSKAKSKSMAARTMASTATRTAKYDSSTRAASPDPANRAIAKSPARESRGFSGLDAKPGGAAGAEVHTETDSDTARLADSALSYQTANRLEAPRAEHLPSPNRIILPGTPVEVGGIARDVTNPDSGGKPWFGHPEVIGILEKPAIATKDGEGLVQQVDRSGGGVGGGVGGGGGGAPLAAPALTPQGITAVIPPASVILSVPAAGGNVVPSEPPDAEAELFRRRYGLAPSAPSPQSQLADLPPRKALDTLSISPSTGLPADAGAQPGSVDPATGLPENSTPSVSLRTNFANNTGVGWMDNQHQKQGSVGLADGSVQQFNRSRLQEALKNSGDPAVTFDSRAPVATQPPALAQTPAQQTDLFLYADKSKNEMGELSTLNDGLRGRTPAESGNRGMGFEGTKMPQMPLALDNKAGAAKPESLARTPSPNGSYYGGANPLQGIPQESMPVAATMVTNAAASEWNFGTGTASPNIGWIGNVKNRQSPGTPWATVYSSNIVGHFDTGIQKPSLGLDSDLLVQGQTVAGAKAYDELTQYRQLAHLNSDGEKRVASGRSVIVLPQSQATDSLGLADANSLRRIESARIDFQAQYNGEKALLSELESLQQTNPKELEKALSTAVPDPKLTSLLEQRRLAEDQLATVEKKSDSNRGDAIKARASVNALNKEVKETVAGTMTQLRGRVDSLGKRVETMKEEVQVAQNSDSTKVRESRPSAGGKDLALVQQYEQKKKELAQLQSALRLLNLKNSENRNGSGYE